MNCKAFLSQKQLPISFWKKQTFIDRLSSRFSGLTELREYREDESFGITHIFIRVGLSVGGHLLAGILTVGIANLVVETNIGNTLCKDGDFSKAREYFNNAYRNSEDDHQGHFFRERRDQVDKDLKEHHLKEQIMIQKHEAGEFPEKVIEHISPTKLKSPDEYLIQDSTNSNQIVSNNVTSLAPPTAKCNCSINSSEVESQPNVITEKSEILLEQDARSFHQGKFSPTKDNFHQAVQEDSRGPPKQLIFQKMQHKSHIKQTDKSVNKEADQLYSDGLVYFKKGQYITAKTCFQNALQKCASSCPNDEFIKMKAAAENCIKKDEANKQQNETAEVCYRLGMGHIWRDEFANAKTCFEDAYLKCTADYVNKPLFYEKQLDAESGIRKQEQQKWQNRA
ncbi:unnamed protein product, partial [Allacma fusca]